MGGHGKRCVGHVSSLFQSSLLLNVQFPIGMGTGAVYVTLSGLKSRSDALVTVETVFYFLNIILFLLNSSTLLIQAVGK